MPFISAGYGFAEERFRFQVREIEIPVPNFPKALDGLRIAQLSDIHVGSYMSVSEVRRAVGMANDLSADLAVVTGDFLTARGDPLEDCIAELSRLRAHSGFGVATAITKYTRGGSESAAALPQHGMGLLRQENVEVRWNGSPST